MITKPSKNYVRKRIHGRVRKKISGTESRPRLNVYRSNKNIYAQLIDDEKKVTLASASTNEKDLNLDSKGYRAAAEKGCTLIVQRAINKGYETNVFDRRGYLYHWRVKALAESAREAGLEL